MFFISSKFYFNDRCIFFDYANIERAKGQNKFHSREHRVFQQYLIVHIFRSISSLSQVNR